MFFISNNEGDGLDYVAMTNYNCFCTDLSTLFSKLSTFTKACSQIFKKKSCDV